MEAEERDHESRGGNESRSLSPVVVLSWVMGAMSVLSLIDNAHFYQLHGWIESWVRGYHDIILKVTDALFGWLVRWIDVDSITIDEIEAHLSTLLILCFGIWMRCQRLAEYDRRCNEVAAPMFMQIDRGGSSRLQASISTVIVAVFTALAMLISPSPFGSVLVGITFAWVGYRVSRRYAKKDRSFNRHLRVSVIGTGVTLLLLVFANELFRSGLSST